MKRHTILLAFVSVICIANAFAEPAEKLIDAPAGHQTDQEKRSIPGKDNPFKNGCWLTTLSTCNWQEGIAHSNACDSSSWKSIIPCDIHDCLNIPHGKADCCGCYSSDDTTCNAPQKDRVCR